MVMTFPVLKKQILNNLPPLEWEIEAAGSSAGEFHGCNVRLDCKYFQVEMYVNTIPDITWVRIVNGQDIIYRQSGPMTYHEAWKWIRSILIEISQEIQNYVYQANDK